MSETTKQHTNLLIHETSPYLLQHAHNPVEWHPWNEDTLAKAKDEDKPILVSIGYSACHWCHVMEHESFEDAEVAQMMNDNFICIKVDREERPDVDQVYMDAVQAISGRGGWPLNAFALPDGRPFWGATYFPKEQWLSLLDQIRSLFLTQRENVEKQAEDIEEGVQRNDLISLDVADVTFSEEQLEQMVLGLSRRFDIENGGTMGAPKFPMPNIYQFLIRYWYHTKDDSVLAQVENTLIKMSAGGIYDQVGGGFARYAVDDHWHVPHFEKMLYDNAQLVSLFSEVFAATGNKLYEAVIDETLEFVNKELLSSEGGFYSALDADSDGEEGKFYVWTKQEFSDILGEDAVLVGEYFGIDHEAYWENGQHVLVKAKSLKTLSQKYGMDEVEVQLKISISKQKLLDERNNRVRPGLDDKILTSWNALMLKGYVDAYKATKNNKYLDIAGQNADFIIQNLLQSDGRLFRNFKNGKVTIPGFLDDYSFTIEALIALYEVSGNESWIKIAHDLAELVLAEFYNEETGLFFYTADFHKDVVSKKTEVLDNVIPASNSSIAKGLFKLSLLFEKPEYSKIVNRMVASVLEKMQQFPSAFTNWGIQLVNLVYPMHTFVITGPDAAKFRKELLGSFHPDILSALTKSKSNLPVFKNRIDLQKSQIFVCTGNACQLPVSEINEALSFIQFDS